MEKQLAYLTLKESKVLPSENYVASTSTPSPQSSGWDNNSLEGGVQVYDPADGQFHNG